LHRATSKAIKSGLVALVSIPCACLTLLVAVPIALALIVALALVTWLPLTVLIFFAVRAENKAVDSQLNSAH
jgi:hypothetical protein